ncbi:MAG: hypothetical protein K9N35_00780 [Candidatus Marinimicrobia bacterium]|nr:hypothetical protein [Candidatus Neomarinimicrobiota bacterium]
MKNDYLCPYCRGNLKVDNNIVIAVRTQNEQRGLLLLSPKLGNYRCHKNDSLTFSDGERLESFCPMCHSNLKAINVNSNLAEVIMVDEQGDEYAIFFSEIVGEHSTYKIKDHDIESFGDDAEDYINYFGS